MMVNWNTKNTSQWFLGLFVQLYRPTLELQGPDHVVDSQTYFWDIRGVAIWGFLCVCAPNYNICVYMYIRAHQSADLVTTRPYL